MGLRRYTPYTIALIAGALLAACHPGTDSATAASTPAATAGAAPADGAATEFAVTAADVQALLSGQDGVTLEPVTREGKTAAMRVFGVRAGSVAARIGAQNGDQIESVNDVPASAADASNQWKQATSRDARLTIKGVRTGKPFTTVLKVEGR